MKKLDFYETCRVPTSLYNEEYAKINIYWRIAKKLYDLNENKREGHIPLYLHFIWLGGELPKKYEEVIQSWRINNPKHTVFVWGDKEANQLINDFATDDFRKMYDNCKNFGQKSDILRYLILDNIGGVYSDIDFMCLGNIESLHNVGFFAGICLEKDFQLNNGLIGCAPHHTVMENTFKRVNLDGFDHITCPHTRTLFQTGPWALTDAVKEYIHSGSKLPLDIMFLPPNYFHPFPASKRHEGNWRDYIKDYSFAVHLWECSWQK